MEYKRPHPLNILENTTKYFYLLLLPLLRGLLFSRNGFYDWLSGAWFDLLIISAILLFAVLRWTFTRYACDRNGIYINRGVLATQKSYLPYRRLTMVYTEYPFYFRPFRVMRLKADTDGGYVHSTDFSVTVGKKEALRIFDLSQGVIRPAEGIKKVYHPRWFYVAILSLITSNTLSGVIFASAFISQSGSILGKEFEERLMDQLTNLARILAFGLPPAAAFVAYVILGGWLISFLMNVLRHIRFHVTRQDNCLEIRTGVITPRSYSIQASHINLI